MTESAAPGLRGVVDSWLLELRAQAMADSTRTTYKRNVMAYLDWCDAHGQAAVLTGRQVKEHLASCLDAGAEANYMRTRLTSVKSFAAWCEREDEIPEDTVKDVKRPKVGKKHRPFPNAAEIDKMLATCDRKTFVGIRDRAMILMLRDSGGRSQEMLQIEMDDLKLLNGQVLVHGKGDRDRWLPFTDETATALDKYVRARRNHKRAAEPTLWLGNRGQGFEYGALWRMIKVRGKAVGLDVHPHMFRRFFTDNWLDSGGSLDGLMALTGWQDMSMVRHYAGIRANARALNEHQRLFGNGKKKD